MMSKCFVCGKRCDNLVDVRGYKIGHNELYIHKKDCLLEFKRDMLILSAGTEEGKLYIKKKYNFDN
jgi:hypothetical protein